jgi:DNA-binding XRE family transcriptional regulator
MFTTESSFLIREMATCPHCQLCQYSSASGEHVAAGACRRCGRPLGVVYYAFEPSPDRASVQRTIGAFLRRLRLRRKLSQQVLADRVAMHRTQVCRAEQGYSANLTMLFKAALAMDLEIDRIFVRVRDRRSHRPVNGTGFSKEH